LIPDGVNGIFR